MRKKAAPKPPMIPPKVTTAVKIENGILTVRVNNSPWRNELVLLKADLIGKINEALGETIVRDIRFV